MQFSMIIRNAHSHAWSLQTMVKSIHNTSTLWIKNSMWQMLHFAILVNNLIRIELNSHRKRHEKKLVLAKYFVGLVHWACRRYWRHCVCTLQSVSMSWCFNACFYFFFFPFLVTQFKFWIPSCTVPCTRPTHMLSPQSMAYRIVLKRVDL